jgi:photosystem II stability/assembly factor-like uncharacterized protein
VAVLSGITSTWSTPMSRLLSSTPAAAALVAATALACTEPSSPTSDASPSPESASLSGGGPVLRRQHSGTANRLQAVSPVNAEVVWASGVGGTYVVTTDGGRNWRAAVVPGAELLEFRDVHGVSAQVAYLLAAGVGSDSRIYKTTDGGETWELQFTAPQRNAFYDCFDFWTPSRGLVMADALHGRFPVLRTRSGGERWGRIGGKLPPAQAGEVAFAASGTCLATFGSEHAWIATGGAERARILATTDGGQTWNSYDTPLPQGTPASGLLTVAFRNRRHGIIAGGDILAPDEPSDNVAVSDDGGKTWKLVEGTPFPGAAYGLSYVGAGPHGEHARTVVITGPGGAAWTRNEGRRWHLLPEVRDFWAVAFADPRHGWLVGTEGRIVKIRF